MTTISKAIKKINPNAEFAIRDNDINNIEWINTNSIPKADIEAQIPIVEQEIKDAEVAKKANVASAKTKLQNLGLTVDEVKDAFNI